MRNIIAVIGLLFSGSLTAFPVTDSTRISLLTVAPGEELYSSFGHSAIRVSDPVAGFNICYNWGTFDFETPNFYLKFCRGKLLYFINSERGRDFEYENLVDRRTIREQVLNLNLEQKKRLAELLQKNMMPENRFYKYDFFFDNCATRIRDLLREAFFYQLNFDSTNVAPKTTLRQMLDPYIKDAHPWSDFGIDLVLGLPADQKATPESAMFLPDPLHDIAATTIGPDGRKLVLSEREMPPGGFPANEKSAIDWLTHPLSVMWFIFGLGLLSVWSPGFQVVFDRVFWFVLGAAGLVITFLWFFTDHMATKNNLNLFWALPTHLFWRKARTSLAEYHTILAAILAALMVVFWKFLPQQLPVAALPIALLVVVKGITNFRRNREFDETRN